MGPDMDAGRAFSRSLGVDRRLVLPRRSMGASVFTDQRMMWCDLLVGYSRFRRVRAPQPGDQRLRWLSSAAISHALDDHVEAGDVAAARENADVFVGHE